MRDNWDAHLEGSCLNQPLDNNYRTFPIKKLLKFIASNPRCQTMAFGEVTSLFHP